MRALVVLIALALTLCGCRGMEIDMREGMVGMGELGCPTNPCDPSVIVDPAP